tara:strand:- start:246 stop:947 length:702 start_codon:yes stop_codon:yes gene_type:complete
MSEAALAIDAVDRTFFQGKRRLDVLRGASLSIAPGEIIALIGPSGVGKSTLLQIAGLLERPDAGEIRINGRACARASDSDRTRVRRDNLGFVYQFHHLLPEFSAVENVMLPQMIAGKGKGEARKRATDLLQSVGLGERLPHRPSALSGGEQQRVAIARALANEPNVLLADEPTGNLDPHTAETVMSELLTLVRESRVAALVATHNPEVAARMDRTVTLSEGMIAVVEAPGLVR